MLSIQYIFIKLFLASTTMTVPNATDETKTMSSISTGTTSTPKIETSTTTIKPTDTSTVLTTTGIHIISENALRRQGRGSSFRAEGDLLIFLMRETLKA